jgi:hypothetical protein
MSMSTQKLKSDPGVLERHKRRGWSSAGLWLIVLVGLVTPGVAQADVLNDWNVIAQNQALTLRPTAHGQTRGIAMVQGAVYDAVNALHHKYQPYVLDLATVHARPFGSRKAAIATAAHHVLVEIVAPAQVDGLNSAYATTMATIPNGRVKNEGVRVGAAAADAMLDARDEDGFMASFEFVFGPDAGDWRPLTPEAVDPDPWVGNLTPFLIESPSQFRSEGPNALTSAAYAEEFAEVKEIGALNSSTRTADCGIGSPATSRLSGKSQLRARRGSSRWSTSPQPTAPSPAGTRSTTGTSGGRERRSRRPTPTITLQRRPTRPGSRCSIRRRRQRRRSSHHRSPTTRRATAA